MRICLVVHGFPPLERTGVENYTATLARALVAAGHRVEVFVPRPAPDLPQLSQRREEVDGYGVTWLTTNWPPRNPEEALDLPGVASRFGDFLDRECPEIVHFQHLIKLGLGLVEEAEQRSIPTLLTAHDYYGVCHRFTLLTPDLERCTTLGDSEACARCDLALAHLNRQPDLGDYHMGVLPDQLEAKARGTLEATLAGDRESAGIPAEEWTRAVEDRTKLDERRRTIFNRIDRIVAPTEFLKNQLVAGGVEEDRVRLLRYGIDTAALNGMRARKRDASSPIRFGFLGSLTKHKGVKVLLEAFGKVTEPAELFVWGDSTDNVFVDRMKALASEVGARICGAFRQSELRECLEQVDVVVVPSIWVENYPISIREAFKAKRPVIASRVGALPESVRDGVDGLLFDVGDADALAECMSRLIREDGLLERFIGGVTKVKSITEQVNELVPMYEELVETHKLREDLDLPEHLLDMADRHAELVRTPTRDLFRMALEGLGDLRTGLLGRKGKASPEEWIIRALATDSEAQVLMQDLRRQGDWLRETLASHEQTEEALGHHIEWRERELDGQRQELSWLREQRESLEKEKQWLNKEISNREGELSWLRDERERLTADREFFLTESEKLRGSREKLQEESERLQTERARLLEECDNMQSDVASLSQQIGEMTDVFQSERQKLESSLSEVESDREQVEGERDRLENQYDELTGELEKVLTEREHERTAYEQQQEDLRDHLRATAQLGVLALQAQAKVIGNELGLLTSLLQGEDAEQQEQPPETFDDIVPATRDAIAGLRELLEEVRWRREEMQSAADAADRRLVSLLVKKTGLGRRVRGWARPGRDDS